MRGKHSNGSWRIEEKDGVSRVVSDAGKVVCILPPLDPDDLETVGEWHANAHLIAAGPQMSDALRGAMFQLNQGARIFERDYCVKQIRTAYRASLAMDQMPEDFIEECPEKLRAEIGVLTERALDVLSASAANDGERLFDALQDLRAVVLPKKDAA